MSLANGAAHAANISIGDLIFWGWVICAVFGGTVAAFFKGARDFFFSLLQGAAELGERRHQRRLELARAEHPSYTAGAGPETAKPSPGPCPHRPRNLTAVMSAVDGTHLAWLCQACDTRLPRTFAVLEEDL